MEVQWINRGGILVRRINSERIAEDPRIKAFLSDSINTNLVNETFIWTPPIPKASDEETDPAKLPWTERVKQHFNQTIFQLQPQDVIMQVSPR